MKTDITNADFHDYIISLGNFRIKIWDKPEGKYALLTTRPKANQFTTFKKVDGKLYQVFLSKSDYQNTAITNGFFK